MLEVVEGFGFFKFLDLNFRAAIAVFKMVTVHLRTFSASLPKRHGVVLSFREENAAVRFISRSGLSRRGRLATCIRLYSSIPRRV